MNKQEINIQFIALEIDECAMYRLRKRFLCKDCNFDTFRNEYYVVVDEIWEKCHKSHESLDGMLCIGCLETRLGRVLTTDDFTSAPCNWIYSDQSERLRSRLGL